MDGAALASVDSSQAKARTSVYFAASTRDLAGAVQPGGDLMPDLRVLCLHGYHGSGAILRDQMEPLTASLPANVEFVYVDAPSLATGDFGWWHAGFDGWDRTRDWAIELVCAGPRFDGVFGFSQGAALAGLLTAVQESGSAPPGFRFGFAVMVGGFTSDLPEHAELLRHKLTTPSVHVTGRSDVIVPREDSLRLAADRPTLGIPRSATMRLITDMASQWIERQLAQT